MHRVHLVRPKHCVIDAQLQRTDHLQLGYLINQRLVLRFALLLLLLLLVFHFLLGFFQGFDHLLQRRDDVFLQPLRAQVDLGLRQCGARGFIPK